RNCKIIGLSADPVSDHKNWAKDIQDATGHAPNYPIIGDADLTVAKLYDMLPASEQPGKRTAADNQTVRSVFVIGPDKKIRAMLIYPMASGRNFDEVLRLLDAGQLEARTGRDHPHVGVGRRRQEEIPAGLQDHQALSAHGVPTERLVDP